MLHGEDKHCVGGRCDDSVSRLGMANVKYKNNALAKSKSYGWRTYALGYLSISILLSYFSLILNKPFEKLQKT